jgi:hypothetical protein
MNGNRIHFRVSKLKMVKKHHLKAQRTLGYIKLAKIYKKVHRDTTEAIMGGQTKMEGTL